MIPTLPAVSTVRGTWIVLRDGQSALKLAWIEGGVAMDWTATAGTVAAVLVWKEQPKAPTPFDAARGVVEDWYSQLEHHIDGAERATLHRMVAATIEKALAADREARTADDVTGQNQEESVPDDLTPEAQARDIVGSWAAQYRPIYATIGLRLPDDKAASLRDLEERIVVALRGERMAR